MNAGDVRYLFGFDRWATDRGLQAAAGLPDAEWPTGSPVGSRELGDILILDMIDFAESRAKAAARPD